jgi:hypothetical protein
VGASERLSRTGTARGKCTPGVRGLEWEAYVVALRVLEGVDFRGSFEFFNFKLFFDLFLGSPLFVPFVDLAGFSSSR